VKSYVDKHVGEASPVHIVWDLEAASKEYLKSRDKEHVFQKVARELTKFNMSALIWFRVNNQWDTPFLGVFLSCVNHLTIHMFHGNVGKGNWISMRQSIIRGLKRLLLGVVMARGTSNTVQNCETVAVNLERIVGSLNLDTHLYIVRCGQFYQESLTSSKHSSKGLRKALIEVVGDKKVVFSRTDVVAVNTLLKATSEMSAVWDGYKAFLIQKLENVQSVFVDNVPGRLQTPIRLALTHARHIVRTTGSWSKVTDPNDNEHLSLLNVDSVLTDNLSLLRSVCFTFYWRNAFLQV